MLDKKYDEKCDVWSCGVILYILLCGYPPFNGNSADEILSRVRKGRYSLTSKGWDSISKEAKSLIKKMLEYTPAKRISAEEALTDKWIQSKKAAIELTQIKSVLNNLQSFKVY